MFLELFRLSNLIYDVIHVPPKGRMVFIFGYGDMHILVSVARVGFCIPVYTIAESDDGHFIILYFITYKAYMYRACFVKNLDQNIYYYCSNTYKSSVQDQLGTPKYKSHR